MPKKTLPPIQPVEEPHLLDDAKELHEEDRVLSEEMKVKAREQFRTFIQHSHLRNTNERYKILDVVLERLGHFSADELYAELIQHKVRVSRATVYSTLDLLNEAGILIKHNFRGERAYYEIGIDEPHHDHLICVSCGHISEFKHPALLEMRKQVAEKAGLRVVDHTLQVFARCDDPKNCPRNS